MPGPVVIGPVSEGSYQTPDKPGDVPRNDDAPIHDHPALVAGRAAFEEWARSRGGLLPENRWMALSAVQEATRPLVTALKRATAEIERLREEVDDLRRELLNETYRPEGGEIVMRELGAVKAGRDAERARADQAEAEVERYLRPCEACGYRPPTHDHARDCPRLPALTIKPSEPYIDRLEAALAAERAKTAAVRNMHREITPQDDDDVGTNYGFCHGCDYGWPCPTAQVLAAAGQEPRR